MPLKHKELASKFNLPSNLLELYLKEKKPNKLHRLIVLAKTVEDKKSQNVWL